MLQPFTLFHLLFECYALSSLQNKYLTNFPQVPIHNLYVLFQNMPKKEIYNMYKFISGVKLLVLEFFP